MSGMRGVYNNHTHVDHSHGAVTDPPAQEM